MTNLIALQTGTELVGDYRISRVLGAGGFGITYLASETALDRNVTIKEYFPADFAARGPELAAAPRSESCNGDYAWGLDRFIDEAQTLAKFTHPNIVRVYRYFKANNTAYMVLHFEEGQSLKSWLKSLGRAPRQKELDQIIAPLLDALEIIHGADFLHRDIAPDNIIIRKDGSPVLIDFGSARGEIAAHSKTVSALVKPGYSPYEQYAETGKRQGPWTDIYALAATLYHAVTGKRPPDAPSRMVKDDLAPAKDVAIGAYRQGFLAAIDRALSLQIDDRPQTIKAWRGPLLAPDPKPASWLNRNRTRAETPVPDAAANAPIKGVGSSPPAAPVPDAPGPQGRLLDYFEGLKGGKKPAAPPQEAAKPVAPPASPAGPANATRKLDDAAPILKMPRILQRMTVAAADKPTPPPAAVKKAEAKRTPRPKRMSSKRPQWQSLAFKLLIGVGVASGAVVLQDRMPRIETSSTSLTTTATGSIARPSEAIERPIAELRAHQGTVSALAFTPDGRQIVSSGRDGTVRVWNAATESLVRTIELDDGPATALAVADGRILTGHQNGRIVLWDLERATKIGEYKRNEAEIWALAFLGSEERFASASHDWKIAIWSADTTAEPAAEVDAHESPVQALAFAVTSRGPQLLSGSADKTLRLWNVEKLDRVRTYRGHRDYVTSVAFSPGGREIASSSLDGNVRIWSGSSPRLQRSLSGHQGRALALAFAPSGDVLASAGEDGKVRIWDYKRRRTPKTLTSHAGSVQTLAFAPSGLFIASAGDDGVIRIWDNPIARQVVN
ncbi:MAG: serine/threonine-protein kinase [Hyphomicrobium sp.]|nr:serine/threonine-protein kinase [Hyphomicrobium sp.]